MAKYDIDTVKSFGTAVCMELGMSREDAERFLDNMVTSDLRGIDSHGVTRFAGYVKRIELGSTSVTAQPMVLSEYPSSMTVDGCNGIGSTIGLKVMDRCIEKAGETGCCFATVKNGSHYGFGGYYVMEAAKRNMIGFSVCNGPKLVAPYGGKAAMLSTNPMSVGIPASRYPDLVLDMATSVSAKGKIALAIKEKRPIPDSWAIDKEGNPTTDPVAADVGTLLPLGGPKGYGISLIIDILCSCLGGSQNSRQIPRIFQEPEEPSGVGYFMGAIDISKFLDIELFKERIDCMFDEFKASPAAPGFSEVMIPGEIEYYLSEKRRREGIELTESTLNEFLLLSKKYGVPWEA